jgi:O-antigen/teichoic acid export membrane protein
MNSILRAVVRPIQDSATKDINLVAGAGLTLVTRIMIYFLVGVTGIVLARALGPENRGIFSIVTVIAAYAAFLELGMGPASGYFIAKGRFAAQSVIANVLTLGLILGVTWIAICVALVVTRPPFIPGEVSTLFFVIIALSGCLSIILRLAAYIAIAVGSVINMTLIELSDPLVRTILIIGGIVLLDFGLSEVLLCWLAGAVFSFFVALKVIGRGVKLRPEWHGELSKALLKFGLRNHAGSMVQGVNLRMDVFLVAAILDSSALGYYAVAFALAELLWQIPFSASSLLFPKVAAHEEEGNARISAATCRRVLFVTLLCVIGALVMGRWAISLYGPEFSAALTPFYILVPSALVITIFKILSSGLAARGMPEASLYSGLAAMPIMLGLCLLLIPAYGIAGAAAASLGAYTVNALVALMIFLRVTKQSLGDTLFIRGEDLRASLDSIRALRGVQTQGSAS